MQYLATGGRPCIRSAGSQQSVGLKCARAMDRIRTPLRRSRPGGRAPRSRGTAAWHAHLTTRRKIFRCLARAVEKGAMTPYEAAVAALTETTERFTEDELLPPEMDLRLPFAKPFPRTVHRQTSILRDENNNSQSNQPARQEFGETSNGENNTNVAGLNGASNSRDRGLRNESINPPLCTNHHDTSGVDSGKRDCLEPNTTLSGSATSTTCYPNEAENIIKNNEQNKFHRLLKNGSTVREITSNVPINGESSSVREESKGSPESTRSDTVEEGGRPQNSESLGVWEESDTNRSNACSSRCVVGAPAAPTASAAARRVARAALCRGRSCLWEVAGAERRLRSPPGVVFLVPLRGLSLSAQLRRLVFLPVIAAHAGVRSLRLLFRPPHAIQVFAPECCEASARRLRRLLRAVGAPGFSATVESTRPSHAALLRRPRLHPHQQLPPRQRPRPPPLCLHP